MIPSPAARGLPGWLLPVIGLLAAAMIVLATLYFAPDTRPVANASASATPLDIVNTSPMDLYERAVREAKTKHDTIELTALSYTGVLPDGSLSADGRAKYYFGTPTWRCIEVVMTSEGVETEVKKCRKHAAVPYPKCTLPELRRRMRGKLTEAPAHLVYSQVGSPAPQWSVNAGGSAGASIPDDCP